MIYWLSVLTAIRFNRIVFVIFYFVYIIIPTIDRLGLLKPVQNMVLNYPLALVCICGLASYLMYRAVVRRDLACSLCGVPWLDFFAGWEKSRLNRFRIEPTRVIQSSYTEQFAEFLNHLFSKRIRSNNRSLLLPHIWGRAYIIFASTLFNWWRLVGLFLLIWFSLIMPKYLFGRQIFFFYVLGLVGGQMCIMSGSDILLPLGRKGWFFSGITTLITTISIMLVLVAALVLLSKMLICIFPPSELISLQGKYIFISIILLPTTSGLFILFRKRMFLSRIIVLTGILISLYCIHSYIAYKGGYIFNMFNLIILILITVASFGFYLAVLYYDNMKRSLC